jgi:GNAT acetyltransferase-like protein
MLWEMTSPAPLDIWRDVLASDPFALVSQSPEWLAAQCALGRYTDASVLYEREDGRRLVLPMARRRGAGAGRVAFRSSFGDGWGMGGPLAPGGVTAEDVEAICAHLGTERGLRTLVRPNPLLAEPWRASGVAVRERIPRVAHVLDLDGGFEVVWNDRFTGGARTNVRKAEKTGVVVEHGASPRHVEAFYGLFEQSLERWASRQHEPAWLTRARGHRRDPIQKFHVLAEMLGDAFTVWIASVDGRPAAAAIVLIGANAHYTRGAMDADVAGPSRANYVLHAEAIRHACEAGCRHYHFGESGTSSSLAQFKTRFGARAYDYDEVRFERLPLTAADRRLRHAVKRAIRFRDAQ